MLTFRHCTKVLFREQLRDKMEVIPHWDYRKRILYEVNEDWFARHPKDIVRRVRYRRVLVEQTESFFSSYEIWQIPSESSSHSISLQSSGHNRSRFPGTTR